MYNIHVMHAIVGLFSVWVRVGVQHIPTNLDNIDIYTALSSPEFAESHPMLIVEYNVNLS